MTKGIKALILSLALIFTGIGGVTSAHEVGNMPPARARISVNSCNGAVIGHKAPWVYGVTATHCIKAPMDQVMVSYGPIWAMGERTLEHGDLSYIRWQASEIPGNVLPLAKELPKPGDGVWISGSIKGDYLPIPGIWLGVPMHLGNIKAVGVYGMVSRGFSGSPVMNTKGELLGVVSVGTFIDSHESTSIVAPWAGITVLPHLE